MPIRALLAAILIVPALALGQEAAPPPPPPPSPPPPPPPNAVYPAYPVSPEQPRSARPVYPAYPVAPDEPPPGGWGRRPRRYLRDVWYIGFGIGGGNGQVSGQGSTFSLRELQNDAAASNVFINFKVGATLTPHLLLGLDVSAINSSASHSGGVTSSVQITNYDAMLTWFPQGRGFFVRGGAGLSALAFDTSVGGTTFGSSSYGGVNLSAGLGYAWWVGRSFNLTANLDFSAQSYGRSSTAPESSSMWNLWLGFDWY